MCIPGERVHNDESGESKLQLNHIPGERRVPTDPSHAPHHVIALSSTPLHRAPIMMIATTCLMRKDRYCSIPDRMSNATDENSLMPKEPEVPTAAYPYRYGT